MSNGLESTEVVQCLVLGSASNLCSNVKPVVSSARTLAMYPVAGPLLTVPVTLVTSFFMLGIEDTPFHGDSEKQCAQRAWNLLACTCIECSVKVCMKMCQAF